MSKSPKFPEEISWIVDKNPVTAYLTRRGYKGWELYDVEQEYKEYYEYDFLVRACKKFKFQPNDLKSAENLLLVLDKWVAFAYEFDLRGGQDGYDYVAAHILNLLHEEYEYVMDEPTKILTKMGNISVDDYQALKKAPLRVVVAAIELYFDYNSPAFDRYSEWTDVAQEVIDNYFDPIY